MIKLNYRYITTPSIAERIASNDCTITESDFFAPPDDRDIKSNVHQSYYDYCEDFNELGELEEFFDKY